VKPRAGSRDSFGLTACLLAAGLLLSACAAPKVSSRFAPLHKEVRAVTAFDPVVKVIRKEVGAEFKDEDAPAALTRAYHLALPDVKVTRHALLAGDAARLRGGLGRFFRAAWEAKSLDTLQVGPELMEILGATDNRFVILAEADGLDRSYGSYALGLTGSILWNLVSFGIYPTSPEDSRLRMSVAVVDREEGKAIYLSYASEGGKPKGFETVEDALRSAFKSFNAGPKPQRVSGIQ
jgi:hypothetical protein